MPSLELRTNVPVKDAKAFIQDFSQFAATLLGKPLAYIAASYTYNETLAWNGTFEPAFLLNIVSLDNINPEANEKYSKELFQYFEEKLGITGSRGYISFHDPGRAYLGHKGTTFSAIFGGK
ncbi:Tautomerase/MIF [Panus rudis PR-1116 ss-1]|nr:Tautomerase/MIF [Panus rudis PR-1116 ss-1]